jgi:hypothetical protein
MKKKLSLTFCKNLILTDFFFDEQKKFMSFNHLLNSVYAFHSYNIVSLNKEFIQFIKIFQFLFLSKERNLLIVIVKNKEQQLLIKNYLLRYKSVLNIIVRREEEYSNVEIEYSSQMKFVISLTNLKKVTLKKFVNIKGINLINIFNTHSLKSYNYQTYQILSSIDSKKKLLFILILADILSAIYIEK